MALWIDKESRYQKHSQNWKWVCVFLVTQSCPTLCNPRDCSPPGSSAQWIFQARKLEWVAISSSKNWKQQVTSLKSRESQVWLHGQQDTFWLPVDLSILFCEAQKQPEKASQQCPMNPQVIHWTLQFQVYIKQISQYILLENENHGSIG